MNTAERVCERCDRQNGAVRSAEARRTTGAAKGIERLGLDRAEPGGGLPRASTRTASRSSTCSPTAPGGAARTCYEPEAALSTRAWLRTLTRIDAPVDRRARVLVPTHPPVLLPVRATREFLADPAAVVARLRRST